ncbi:hypothetical protein LTR56_016180 [Elasticomyces elasticus]|nr:hypothetical protein LTR56_016180 [Elasticomyces elasticus]KAK3642139.1 hypothetical protein LTR22_016260 [Elasticomyces elasticus]KAK4914187.1 hypothetical protein LTR49_017540 [Elasticomyces elasticus]KAK5762548.1 hypothetical protein LTS12_007339 [Elasticomyces elasticus]
MCLASLAQSSPNEQPTEPRLLALPPELRVQIWELVLLSTRSSLKLLQLNRQVTMEALPVLYQRPLAFDAQASLFAWIERSRSSNLRRVHTLDLRLTDVDLRQLLDQDRRSTRTSVWALYQSELERLDHALKALTGLHELTVTPPGASHSMLLSSMYLSFLARTPMHCPRLSRLILKDNEEVLNKVPALRSLASVEFITPDPQSAEPDEKKSHSLREAEVQVTDIGAVSNVDPKLHGTKQASDSKAAHAPAAIRRESLEGVQGKDRSTT